MQSSQEGSSGTSGAPAAGKRMSSQQMHPSGENTVMETSRAGHTIDLVVFTL